MDDPRNYVSIINPLLIDGLEAYIVTDKPAYKPGDGLRLMALLQFYGNERETKVEVIDDNKRVVFEKKVHLKRGLNIVDSILDAGETPGIKRLRLFIDGRLRDHVGYIVEDSKIRKPFYMTIVWHNHQAPNYDPEGRIHSPWAYVYVWKDYLKPYGLGPYHYHAQMLMKHPSYSATYNLSPSLLRQWELLLEQGVEFTDGTKLSPLSREAGIVKEMLRKYIDAAKKGQIDVLTSIYAHTIAGFLTDVLGAYDIVADEIAYGKEVTRRVLEEYEPEGIWTPEMAFSMNLVSIYHDNGIRYTVLDDKHHFQWAEGDKDSPYEPYIVVDTSTKKYITVFFRDQDISNTLSFKNNFYSEAHAWRNAYALAYIIATKWYDKRVKTLVIALDGENWMVFARNPPLTAFFLDKLIIYLETLQDNGFIKLSTLKEMYERVPSKRVLTYIPTNTWLGTFRKWREERPDHENYWGKIATAYRRLLAYERMIQGRDETSNKARWALWHALDSDYWWAEFWSPSIIDMWLSITHQLLDEVLSKVKIKEVKPQIPLREDNYGRITIAVENELDKDVYLTIAVKGPGLEMNHDELKPLMVKARSSYSRIVSIKPEYIGRQQVVVSAVSSGVVISSKSIEIYVNPHIPPSPR